jgi:hypothetical protein
MKDVIVGALVGAGALLFMFDVTFDVMRLHTDRDARFHLETATLGDCVVTDTYEYQITQIGKYSFRAKRHSVFGGSEDTYNIFTARDFESLVKSDCFDFLPRGKQ